MVDVRTNHCELQIESNSMSASCIWFESRSSTRNCCTGAPRSGTRSAGECNRRGEEKRAQAHVIAREGGEEEQRRDILKAVDPVGNSSQHERQRTRWRRTVRTTSSAHSAARRRRIS